MTEDQTQNGPPSTDDYDYASPEDNGGREPKDNIVGEVSLVKQDTEHTPSEEGDGAPEKLSETDQAAQRMVFSFAERVFLECLVAVKAAAGKTSGRASETITDVSKYIKTNDTTDVWGDIKYFARRHPRTVTISMLMLGFFIGRKERRGK